MSVERKVLYREDFNSKWGKSWIQIATIESEENRRSYPNVRLQKKIQKNETEYMSVSLSYQIIKEYIIALIDIHGKAEVEKELGVKIE